MLNTFPFLLTFTHLAPTLLRVFVGILFIMFALEKFGGRRNKKILCFDTFGLRPGKFWVFFVGVLELVFGAFLVVGFLTQISSIILSIIMLGAVLMKKSGAKEVPAPVSYYMLILVVLISLIFTGAGVFAIDWPL